MFEVLRQAQDLGFIGPGDLAPQVQRSYRLGEILGSRPWPDLALDLGSGGGLPGLPLALAHPETSWVLLEGSTRRAEFLNDAVEALRLEERVEVLAERAEVAARGSRRGQIGVVFARSFGGPAVTAECAAGFLSVGGLLIVAEPPGGAPDRWKPAGLAELGLTARESVVEPSAVQVLEQTSLCPDRFPRRVGVPAKRPLF